MRELIFDIESYPNYFLAYFRDLSSGEVITFEHWKSRNHIQTLAQWLHGLTKSDRVISYNGWYYDYVILEEILCGNLTTNQEVYDFGQENIFAKRDDNTFPKRADLAALPFTSIDLMELWNLRQSLKKTAAYLGYRHLEDLPYAPGTTLDLKAKKKVLAYCAKDIGATEKIYSVSQDELTTRQFLIEKYDLAPEDITLGRPRIAKNAIAKMWMDRWDDLPPKPSTAKWARQYRFASLLDKRINFKSKTLQTVLEEVKDFSRPLLGKSDPFKLTVTYPDDKDRWNTGYKNYTLGEGGLHDDFGTRVYEAGHGYRLIDVDVSSYYPSLMLNLGLLPRHLKTGGIKSMVESIVKDRLKFKKEGNKSASNALKIVINSLYGMMGNQYSFMYDPFMKLAVCLNGQLYLLMLIERLEMQGVETIYANTDGIVIKCHDQVFDRAKEVIDRWGRKFSLGVDIEYWDGIYCLNTNDYFWVKGEGEQAKIKGKKTFSIGTGVSNRVNAPIIAQAVMAYYQHGYKPEDWMRDVANHGGFKGFLIVSAPTKSYLENRFDIDGSIGGKLPKTIRYYHALRGGRAYKFNTNTGGEIVYHDATSVRMAFDLETYEDADDEGYVLESAVSPPDLDLNWYVEQAYKLIRELETVDSNHMDD